MCVSVPGGGVVCLSRGGGVCLFQAGVSGPEGGLLRGGGITACTEADTPPPCGQTHACKNITLATTSLRPVIIVSGKT